MKMSKKGATNVFKKGDLIFAKVKGYPAWPARVESPTDAKCNRFKVFFFGTYETATIKKEDMWIYNENTKARYDYEHLYGFQIT